ncbi:MAG: hypothetical protein PHD99_04945 [Candidatus Moranbacteria bacterium]|nr:hypothetical protein [Candidatus Moranbacteria bacterium]
MNTPFNTGKVLIGCNYQPSQRRTFTKDELKVQDALLRIKRKIDWDGVVIVVVLAALILSPWIVALVRAMA